jgi:hypothetical protein
MRTPSRVAVRGALLAALLAGPGLLVGCSGDEDTAADATAAGLSTQADGGAGTATKEPSPADDDGGTDAPPFPADVSADTAEPPPDARVTVRDIRIGRHDGFDRVVLEVGGTGTPGWDVRYVSDPSAQGSGDPVAVAGNAVLQVGITGAGYPDDTGVAEYSGPDPLTAADTETVTELVFDATFEGMTIAFVGTRAEAPFRVYLLADPVRVVVEVRDPS